MLVTTYGSAVYGVEAIRITIEVNAMDSGTSYMMVGLPDSAVKESLQRVESAIKSIGCSMPRKRLVVNLAPADIKKSGLMDHGLAYHGTFHQLVAPYRQAFFQVDRGKPTVTATDVDPATIDEWRTQYRMLGLEFP